MTSATTRYLLTLTLGAFALAGCGNSANDTAATKPAAPAATPTPAAAPAPKSTAAPAPTPASTPAPEAKPAAAPAAAPAPAAVPATDPAGAGRVTGKITLDGAAPKRATLETEGDPKCHAMHADKPLLSDREVVGADGGVQWAFAYIKNPPAGTYPVPTDNAELDQIGCAYSPHVMGMRVGQKLIIKNTDPTLHNVRGIARTNKSFNFGQPEATPPRERIFDQAEMEIKLKCDIHSWMTGYLFAMDHPFFAVTDASGSFTIPALPAGDYTLVVWHEAYGSKEIPVSVKAGAATDASAKLKPTA